jgi:hypothetical protein
MMELYGRPLYRLRSSTRGVLKGIEKSLAFQQNFPERGPLPKDASLYRRSDPAVSPKESCLSPSDGQPCRFL